jgi:prophage maintenance system killer protein/prophage antirepressor-like protein
MKKQNLSKIIIYQAPNGAIELKGDFDKETVWASLDQIATVLGRDKSVISRHIRNIFKEKELQKISTVAFFATVQKEGEREVERNIEYFNLDVIISVGYRVNSKVATEFRQWATQTLRQHITKGYTINKKVLQNNYTLFQNALLDIQKISQNKLTSNAVLELVKVFSSTWFSLDAFDKDNLNSHKTTSKNIQLEAEQLYKDIEIFKQELQSRGEANELFAQEKEKESLAGIFGNIFQTAFRQDVYPSIEAKASNLLYFIVKNHPFNDGNKRTGAFTFIWFLQKAKISFQHKITPEALTAITLLIATSQSKDKQKMIDLVTLLLSRK